MTLSKNFLFLLVVGGLLLTVPTSCRQSSAEETAIPVPEPTLVSSELVGEYTASQLRARFTGASAVFQLFIRYSIKAYRLEYNTITADGKTIRASGALIVPDVNTGAPLLSMQHGTITSENDAPSNFQPSSEAYTFGSVFASQGYIIAAPDYIGYGASKDVPHTYEHRQSLATASLDMLRAAREFIAAKTINWDKRVFLAGYSEGGYATLSLHKKIEQETGNEFNLVAVSCGAGAYDKSAFMRKIINQKTTGTATVNRLYVWVLQTYDRLHGLNRPMTAYFREPYASQITASGRNATINVSLDQTFSDTFKKGINDGTDTEFLKAVADNDVYDWKPRTPLRLYHGDADEIVDFLNSQNAYDAMQKRGATNVALFRLEGRTHATALTDFILGTYSFFGATQ